MNKRLNGLLLFVKYFAILESVLAFRVLAIIPSRSCYGKTDFVNLPPFAFEFFSVEFLAFYRILI